jgi:SPP1 gp7 family putative phage head morphogenesis protein
MSLFDSRFWEDEDNEFWDDIAPIILSSYMLGIDGGIATLPQNMQQLADFDKISAGVSRFAREYRYNRIKGITDTTRKQTQNAIADWINSGSPLSVLEATLEPIFGEARASRIAITEVTRVFAEANRQAFESTGMVGSMVWMTSEDERVCELCGDLEGTHIGISDIDAVPPAHVNCRCWLNPVLDEGAFGDKLDEVLG